MTISPEGGGGGRTGRGLGAALSPSTCSRPHSDINFIMLQFCGGECII